MFGSIEGAGFELIDDRFAGCVIGHALVERLWTGSRWAEGPAWFPAGRYLVWSDIPNNRLLRWDEVNGVVSDFRNPANNTNGNSVDREGRLISCEHLTRRVTRTEHDGSISVLCDKVDGKRLNSPNDVVVKSDGSIWFTDPDYGILNDYEGKRVESELGGCYVYRVDPQTAQVSVVATDFVKPNGLAFSVDEKHLYVSDTGGTHVAGGPAHIRKLAVGADGKSLDSGSVFIEFSNGFFDGFRLDTDGRIWTSAGEGVNCYDPDGTHIGRLVLPNLVSNVEFGGAELNRLFITATTSLYSVYLSVNGLKR